MKVGQKIRTGTAAFLSGFSNGKKQEFRALEYGIRRMWEIKPEGRKSVQVPPSTWTDFLIGILNTGRRSGINSQDLRHLH